MFWLYVPPIIFISALIILFVIFGKKIALLRKEGNIFRSESDHSLLKIKGGEKWKKLRFFILRLLEGIMNLVKIGIKKSETVLSKALYKMKERRLGRKISGPPIRKNGENLFFERDDEIRILESKEKKNNERGGRNIEGIRLVSEEVIVKKKEEPLPKRILPKKAQEDKIKEEALIYRISENPKAVEAYRELGDYYMSIENIKDAKDSFKMVLKLCPRDLKAKSSLREIEMKMRLGN